MPEEACVDAASSAKETACFIVGKIIGKVESGNGEDGTTQQNGLPRLRRCTLYFRAGNRWSQGGEDVRRRDVFPMSPQHSMVESGGSGMGRKEAGLASSALARLSLPPASQPCGASEMVFDGSRLSRPLLRFSPLTPLCSLLSLLLFPTDHEPGWRWATNNGRGLLGLPCP